MNSGKAEAGPTDLARASVRGRPPAVCILAFYLFLKDLIASAIFMLPVLDFKTHKRFRD